MLRSYNLQFEGSYSISYQYPSSKKAEKIGTIRMQHIVVY